MRTAISVLGIDIGKNVCSLVGLDVSGKVALRRRVKRETLISLAAKLPPCIVAMEACCGAHHIGRIFAAHEHEVRLMSPEYGEADSKLSVQINAHIITAQNNDEVDYKACRNSCRFP